MCNFPDYSLDSWILHSAGVALKQILLTLEAISCFYHSFPPSLLCFHLLLQCFSQFFKRLFIYLREKERERASGGRSTERKRISSRIPAEPEPHPHPSSPPMPAGSQDQDWDHDLNGIKSLMPNQPVASPRLQLTVFINSFILTLPHPFIYCKPNLFILWPSAK